MNSSKTFNYFAYGSNLLTRRIHINNPSAIRIGIGKLKNYRLDFITYSCRWKGAVATIVPKEGCHVWGALWEINLVHLPNLNKQEGVHMDKYYPLEVDVQLPDESIKTCRVYQQYATPAALSNMRDLPLNRRPSAIYLNTIINGAKESGLPQQYICFLEHIPHNGYEGEIDINLES